MSASIFLNPHATFSTSLGLCEDGYVRLDFKTLLETELVHLVSGLDDDPVGAMQCGTRFAAITGFTEWISTIRPALSIGWDWVMGSASGVADYSMLGKPRSNIMLVDANCRDLGVAATEDLLATRLDRLHWQHTTGLAITSRYV